MIRICPRCNQRYSSEDNIIDYIHECKTGNDALDNEDVVVVGSWSDYTGSDTIALGQPLMQGAANKVWGTRAGIEGEDVETLTRRGNRASTHRTRQHLSFIKLEGGNDAKCN